MEKEITKDGVKYFVRELDTWADQMELIDYGNTAKCMMRLAVRQENNQPINWNKVSKESGADIFKLVIEVNKKSKDF